MKIIMCLDTENGIKFNMRRQSRDREVIGDIIKNYSSKKLWIREESEELFAGLEVSGLYVDNGCLEKASKEDYCFIESDEINKYMDKVEELVVYRWDKVYPKDEYIDLSMFKKTNQTEIKGYSHDIIIKEIYKK